MIHTKTSKAVICFKIIPLMMFFMGLYLAFFGAILLTKGGSFYYLACGIATLISGIWLWQKKAIGAWLYLLIFLLTIAWAIWEKGTNFWALFPRVFCIAIITALIFIFFPFVKKPNDRTHYKWLFWPIALITIAYCAFLFGNLFRAQYLINDPSAGTRFAALIMSDAGDWTHYARNGQGRRFAPFDQINVDNVNHLEVAWTVRTGDIASKGAEDQNTPLQIGDTVYGCSPHNVITAIDVDSGDKRWTFDSKARSPLWQRCRALGYADMTENSLTADQWHTDNSEQSLCAKRIIMAANDNRLFALDAKTGKKCEDFGIDGIVDLKQGMGKFTPGMYMQTSGPTVIENGMIIIAGWVLDNLSTGEPSGVVRAFSTVDGSLLWAWDLGNKNITKEPPVGETYTLGTPNVWTTPAFDEKLGLIYLPTGNATPDYWGGERTKTADEYNSSIVAVNYHTGKEQWKFQTTHHDIWDYDVPAQPALYDIPDGHGALIPALIQTTKRGEIFMLDRRDGTPIAEVIEKPVPTTGVAKGDYVSPTQPYSVGMPSIRYPEFKESDMWGMTMFDQLLCRIDFKEINYQGDFTPPSTQRTLQYPSNLGGMNWGSVAIDEQKGYLIINDIRIAMAPQLIKKETADDEEMGGDGHSGYSPQRGTPFGVTTDYFLSKLGIPCNTPPYGTLTAIDLGSRKIVWQVPLGTTIDSGPFGIKTRIPMQVGMPSLGGPLSTGGQLIFFSGTQDYYLRAFDSRTGKEVWKSRLPVGGQATPMSYISPNTGVQYIVVTASGSRGQPDRGDYIIAYRLKK